MTSSAESYAGTYDCSTQTSIAIDAATRAVQAGECIVLPTDTVYGIGANAFDAAAVQRLLDAKERGRDMPPPVLIAEPFLLPSLTAEITPEAQALADAFWPGALTLIVRAQHALRMDLGDVVDTLAVRVPDHDFTRAMLRRTGPLAVSSANVSGQPAALSIVDAQQQLHDRVSVWLDAGICNNHVPSTIIDATGPIPTVLRAGRLTPAELIAVVPTIQFPDDQPSDDTTSNAHTHDAPSASEDESSPEA